MPDRLDFCLRRYEAIRAQPGSVKTDAKAAELADWIERSVLPIVEDLSQRCDFRKQARWPIEQLLPGSKAPERELVESVDRRLVDAARALAMVAAPEPTTGVGAANCAVEVAGILEPDCTPSATNGVAPPNGAQLIALIADKPWHDLACGADYFGPAAGLNLRSWEAYQGPGSLQVQFFDLLPYANPRLRPLGDFISRMVIARAQHWRDVLERFSAWRRNAVSSTNDGDGTARWTTVDERMGLLAEDFERLRHALTGGRDFQLREASVILVEAQAAFRPRADFSWLGEVGKLAAQAARFRYQIERRHDFALVDQIAAALSEIAILYRSVADSGAILQQALAHHELVLVDGAGRREAYWKQQPINADWRRQDAAWRLLIALAERLHTGGSGTDVFQIGASAKDARYHLKRIIPGELDQRIAAAGKRTYIFKLEAAQVCLLRFREDERLVRAHEERCGPAMPPANLDAKLRPARLAPTPGQAALPPREPR